MRESVIDLRKIENKRGERTSPCGTPARNSVILKKNSPYFDALPTSTGELHNLSITDGDMLKRIVLPIIDQSQHH